MKSLIMHECHFKSVLSLVRFRKNLVTFELKTFLVTFFSNI